MKTIKHSMLAVLAISTFTYAGGDIAPIVEPVVEAPVVITEGGAYIGLAYGYMGEDYTRTDKASGSTAMSFNENFSSVMLQSGYKFNSYVAVEGRYWFGADDVTLSGYVNPIDAPDAWGVYVKPMYPVTDELDIYALLGYADVDTSLNNVNGFSWGAGASYAVTDNISVFADYVSLYNNDQDIANGTVNKSYDIDTVNVGVTYNF